MRPSRRCARRFLVAALTGGLAACAVTLREPEIKPLNPVRQYPVAVPRTCDGVLAAMAALGLVVAAITRDETTCLVQTDRLRLSEAGDDINHLGKIAYVTAGESFAHGRYSVTVNAAPAAAGLTRVRLTTRIEGYDSGYRLLRSRGIVEQAIFDHLQATLGVEPVSDS